MLLLLVFAIFTMQGGRSSPQPSAKPNAAASQDSAKRKSYEVYQTISAVKPAPQVEQSTNDDKLARYTFWLAMFTGALVLLTAATVFIGVRQGKQIEREFVATFRPRLKLRQASSILEDGRYSVEFSIANDGGTSATIIGSRAAIMLKESGKALPPRPLEEAVEAVEAQTVNAGSSIVVRWSDQYTTKRLVEATNQPGGTTNLFFVGDITYRDGTGTVRRIGFFRVYSWENLRFRTIEDPDFEYAD